MNTQVRGIGRTLWVAVRAMAILTVTLGVGYTVILTLVGQLVLPAQTNGSIITDQRGAPVGSALIGQTFADDEGAPLAEYFQPRPSAAGDGYDGGASSGSNLGPENADLIASITERRAQVAAFNDVDVTEVPADAVTASASGLDPHISVAYATVQIARVAAARALPVDTVRELVDAHTAGLDAGYLGESRVNVLALNLALDELEG